MVGCSYTAKTEVPVASGASKEIVIGQGSNRSGNSSHCGRNKVELNHGDDEERMKVEAADVNRVVATWSGDPVLFIRIRPHGPVLGLWKAVHPRPCHQLYKPPTGDFDARILSNEMPSVSSAVDVGILIP